MPARGLEAAKARARYGHRPDEREEGLRNMFLKTQVAIDEHAEFSSDQKTLYPRLVREVFPQSLHHAYKGRKACVAGQGELKEGWWDPLFSLNHTAAMLRANINRLFRRTWCISKTIDGLVAHLWVYVAFHNEVLLQNPT